MSAKAIDLGSHDYTVLDNSFKKLLKQRKISFLQDLKILVLADPAVKQQSRILERGFAQMINFIGPNPATTITNDMELADWNRQGIKDPDLIKRIGYWSWYLETHPNTTSTTTTTNSSGGTTTSNTSSHSLRKLSISTTNAIPNNTLNKISIVASSSSSNKQSHNNNNNNNSNNSQYHNRHISRQTSGSNNETDTPYDEDFEEEMDDDDPDDVRNVLPTPYKRVEAENVSDDSDEEHKAAARRRGKRFPASPLKQRPTAENTILNHGYNNNNNNVAPHSNNNSSRRMQKNNNNHHNYDDDYEEVNDDNYRRGGGGSGRGGGPIRSSNNNNNNRASQQNLRSNNNNNNNTVGQPKVTQSVQLPSSRPTSHTNNNNNTNTNTTATTFTTTVAATNTSTAVSTSTSTSRRPKKKKTPEWIVERRFTLGKQIGEGSFGTVFEALNDDGIIVAVKRMNILNKSQEIEDLLSEIELMRGMCHKNIVEYLGAIVDTEHCFLFIFQEWVSRGSVAALLRDTGPFTPPVVRSYTRQILHGLEYLHSMGIIHRDIKGGNILVHNDGNVKLADFGASIKLNMDQTQEDSQIKGTPYFMAPEVLSQGHYGRKGDIWAVGCTMIQMLSGEPPWKDMNLRSILQLHQIVLHWEKGPPPCKTTHILSKEIQECLQLCFQKNETARPNASELLQCAFLCDTVTIVNNNNLEDSGNNDNSFRDQLEESHTMTKLRQEINLAQVSKSKAMFQPSHFLQPPFPRGPSNGGGGGGGGGPGGVISSNSNSNTASTSTTPGPDISTDNLIGKIDRQLQQQQQQGGGQGGAGNGWEAQLPPPNPQFISAGNYTLYYTLYYILYIIKYYLL
jgi:serine/threonine protein kinase